MRPSNECPSRGPAADEGIIWAPPPSLFQPRSSRLAVPFQPRQRARTVAVFPPQVLVVGVRKSRRSIPGVKKKEKARVRRQQQGQQREITKSKKHGHTNQLTCLKSHSSQKKSSNSSNHNSHLSNLRLTAQFYHQNAHRVLHRVSHHHKGT